MAILTTPTRRTNTIWDQTVWAARRRPPTIMLSDVLHHSRYANIRHSRTDLTCELTAPNSNQPLHACTGGLAPSMRTRCLTFLEARAGAHPARPIKGGRAPERAARGRRWRWRRRWGVRGRVRLRRCRGRLRRRELRGDDPFAATEILPLPRKATSRFSTLCFKLRVCR